jgi:hypothetical protein
MAEYPAGYRPQGEIGGESGHEPTDVGIRSLVIAGLILVAICVGVLILVSSMMGHYRRKEKVILDSTPPLFADQQGQFPGPRLQQNPHADLSEIQKADAVELSSYGWVDRKAKIAKIPIDRAIEILASRGLPTADREGEGHARESKEEPSPAKPERPVAESRPKSESRKPEPKDAATPPGSEPQEKSDQPKGGNR